MSRLGERLRTRGEALRDAVVSWLNVRLRGVALGLAFGVASGVVYYLVTQTNPTLHSLWHHVPTEPRHAARATIEGFMFRQGMQAVIARQTKRRFLRNAAAAPDVPQFTFGQKVKRFALVPVTGAAGMLLAFALASLAVKGMQIQGIWATFPPIAYGYTHQHWVQWAFGYGARVGGEWPLKPLRRARWERRAQKAQERAGRTAAV